MGNESQSGGLNPQGKPQGTSADPSEKKTETSDTNTEEPKLYTEKELQTKLSELQSKIRKSEVQVLRDKINDLEASNAALQTQIEDVDVLKSTVAELHKQIEDGIPEDGKEAFAKYSKLMASLNEERIRNQKEFNIYKGKHLEGIAVSLADKFGIDKDVLLKLGDETRMKAYAAEHFDPSIYKAKQETPQTVVTQESTKEPEQVLERPIPPNEAAGGGKTFFTQKEIDEMDLKTYNQYRPQILKLMMEGKIK